MKSNVSNYMQVIPISFMSINYWKLQDAVRKDGGYIAVNFRFDKMITSLSTAGGQNEGILDKEATSYDDVFDALN